ncbi:MAG: glycoside hydrolase family 13 protein [Candidatus Nanopelagicaceae bacterium]
MIDLLELIHHDGSECYVERIGESRFRLSLRIPSALTADRVALRTVRDGEPVYFEAERGERLSHYITYYVELSIHNPRTNYRWLIGGDEIGLLWLNQSGLQHHDVSDIHDFVITNYKPIPTWARSSVIYQIFPDRFASSGREYEIPEWAVPRNWDQWPEGASPNTSFEYFGGDLWGVIERLDHLQELGIDVLYFTPFFRAGSIHRYDAATFDEVDPLLGGNEALIALVEAAHRRGMRVIGDITLNHSGDKHEWFLRAKEGDPLFSDFYSFDPSLEHGYESWLGVKSLPKFNYRSGALRERLISGESSVLRKWLRAPFHLDGWRVDVANMSGRLRDLDLTHEIARLARAAIESEGEEKILIAEHNHDAAADLDGDGWHGNMNYTSFRNPAWNWLIKEELATYKQSRHGNFPRLRGNDVVAVIREFSTRQPFSTYSASWNLLSSHDSARVRTMVGSHELQRVAIAFAMTMPGTPMIFAGDEIGAEGMWGEDSRSPYPWHGESPVDERMREIYKELIRLRKNSHALAHGGLQWIAHEDDFLIYIRESREECLLISLARNNASFTIDLDLIGGSRVELISGDRMEVIGSELHIEFNGPGYAIHRVQ